MSAQFDSRAKQSKAKSSAGHSTLYACCNSAYECAKFCNDEKKSSLT